MNAGGFLGGLRVIPDGRVRAGAVRLGESPSMRGAAMAATKVRPSDPYGTRRWAVHLGLLASVVVSLLVLVGRMGVSLHIVAGLCFAGLVGAHLAQRWRTLRTLSGDLVDLPRWRTSRGRLALADGVLVFLAGNVVLSGIADWLSPQPVMVGIAGLAPLNWHTTTSLLLVVYLAVHVLRRRGRLRHSRVR
jgi:hypothetical protein